MTHPVSRRTFLTQVAAASIAAPLILPRLSFANPANSRLQHASIGVTAQAAHDLSNIASHERVDVVALCDVDATKLEQARAQYPNARLYRDWREMLEKEEKNIDSVNVSVPDHHHAPATMTALRMKKHVFCEKPLTHEVYEARKVAQAAKKAGVATQMGNQIHSHEFYRTAVQWLQEGAIGKVKEWHSWVGAIFTNDSKMRPEGSDPIPSDLDWDLWLGVAPERPYKKSQIVDGKEIAAYHPFYWRTFRDFGGGAVGDFGCHIYDPIFTALDIQAPLNVSATTESQSPEVYPAWTIANYEFPAVKLSSGKTIKSTWRDGGLKPEISVSPHIPAEYELPASGSIVVGEDGTLVIPHVGNPKLFPEAKFANYPVPVFEEKSHYHEFVEVALNGGQCGSHFQFAGPMTETVLLANIAGLFPGKTLEWNAKRMKFKKAPEATKMLRRKYRDGWEIKGL